MPAPGEKIWVETVLTLEEWKNNHQIFSTCKELKVPVEMFDCEFKWRYKMGGSLTGDEVRIINARMDAALKLVK